MSVTTLILRVQFWVSPYFRRDTFFKRYLITSSSIDDRSRLRSKPCLGAGRESMSVQFPAMTNLTSALRQLAQERDHLATRLQQLNTAISALTGVRTGSRGSISAAGRARIAAAQRARWAKVKGQKVVSIASRPKRKMSGAAIARIRAAQKARWAKWRREQKSA